MTEPAIDGIRRQKIRLYWLQQASSTDVALRRVVMGHGPRVNVPRDPSLDLFNPLKF